MWKRPQFFNQQNYFEKNGWKRRGFFQPSKLHRKSMLKWRGNLSKFGVPRINVISMSNQCGFDVVCPLGRDNFGCNLTYIYALAGR